MVDGIPVGDDRSAPLQVHVLFHPHSQSARRLARHLYVLLNGPSTDLGPRIPVRFGQGDDGNGLPTLPGPGIERALVVVLVDARMVRSATEADRESADGWARLVEDLLDRYPTDQPGACSVLLVALDSAAFTLSDRLQRISFVRLDVHGPRHLEFHMIIACLRLLQGRPATEETSRDALPPSDVELFLSHAKRDLPREVWRGPMAALQTALTAVPLKAWRDSSEIRPGADFEEHINTAVRGASAVVVVLTDTYSSREWCRREVLAAKAAGCPVVVVDAIESQVVRLFPYIGNAPTVRWRAALAEATHPDHQPEPAGTREHWEAEDAETVVLVTLLEALRHLHECARLHSSAEGSDLVLGTPPEAITVAAAEDGTTRVLYPDPPLGREELHLVTRLRPDLDVVTPLQRLARSESPKGFPLVALSLSGAPDAGRFGGSDLHLATMAHDLALYLLLGGLRLLYGGVLGHGAVGRDGRVPGDDVNYVERLMELVERYSPLAREAGRPIKPIENWLAWPMHEELSEEDRNRFQRDRARLTELPRPDDLDVGADEFRRGQNGQYPTNTPLAGYVRSRCLTEMRKRSTEAVLARVALGGTLDGYIGPLPGVAEELLGTLRAGRPLYLLGAFGGATAAVLDVLRGADRVEMTSHWCERHVGGWRALVDEYRRRGHAVTTPEEMADELRGLGAGGLAGALSNGLSEQQNDELATTTDGLRATELILRGLRAVQSGK
jgi:hypothetical protein